MLVALTNQDAGLLYICEKPQAFSLSWWSLYQCPIASLTNYQRCSSKVGSPHIRWWQGCLLPERVGENLSLTFRSLLETSFISWLMIPSSFFKIHHPAFVSVVTIPSSAFDSLTLWFRWAHLGNLVFGVTRIIVPSPDSYFNHICKLPFAMHREHIHKGTRQ